MLEIDWDLDIENPEVERNFSIVDLIFCYKCKKSFYKLQINLMLFIKFIKYLNYFTY